MTNQNADFVHFLGFILFTLAVLLISLPILYAIRSWAYDSAFDGFSKTHRNKILRSQSQRSKHTLFFLLEYKNPHKTKRNLIYYYCYIFVVLVLIVSMWLRSRGMFLNETRWYLLFKTLLDIIVGTISLLMLHSKTKG